PPPTIPSIILENLPTFNSAFRFEERLRSLETSFSEYRQTNQFADAVSAIPGIVQQFMTQQMTKAVRESVQIQTDRLQDSLQRENDESLRNIDENMNKIIKGQVKNQVKEQVSRVLPRIEESTTGSQSRQMSASESAFAEEPVQTTCQMEEPPHPVFETGADDQPIVQTSQHPEWFSQPRRPPSPNRAWNTTLLTAQGDAQTWISDLARQTDARSSFNELLDTPIDFSNFIMHRLNVDTLTPDLLAGPTYELMRGSCTSLTELEYHLEEKKGDFASSTTPPTLTPTTTVKSAPRLSAAAKGKQPSRATTPVEPTDIQRTEAEQLKIILKRSRQETHISQQSGSGTDEGTELAKDDEEDKETGKGDDEVRESKGESEEKKKQVKRKREVLTRFLEHQKIVRRKAM
nr:hypothetical protein [Tanacetum cinerariifolium]GFB46327.1 hypothetical protein [Tanacetum cinerariifolium]